VGDKPRAVPVNVRKMLASLRSWVIVPGK
jgi:hypothetical protein